jgi:hypothetical protein
MSVTEIRDVADHIVFMTEESFMRLIQDICDETGMNNLEAIVHYCKTEDIDQEDILPLIGRPMTEKIKNDAMNSGMMRRESTLPI